MFILPLYMFHVDSKISVLYILDFLNTPYWYWENVQLMKGKTMDFLIDQFCENWAVWIFMEYYLF